MLDTAWPPSTFAGRLTTAERDWALTVGSRVRFEPGALLVAQGAPNDCVFLFCHGETKTVVDGESGLRLLGFQGPGDLMGDLPYLTDEPWPVSVVALRQRPVSAVRLDRDRFAALLENYPRTGLVLARTMAERLRTAERRRSAPAGWPVERRVLRVLVELTWLSGSDSASADVEIPLTQLEIAQLLDVAQVSVQRALRALAAQGLVKPGYRRINLPCVHCAGRAADNRATGSCEH
jgi:CRP-like cAMP-binding protein